MVIEGVTYETMTVAAADDLAAFYRRQGHATSAQREQLAQMIDNTACFVTARRNGELIGIARGVTDGVWGRLVECKLDPSCQGPACVTRTAGRIEHDTAGIAHEMARRVIAFLRELGCERIDALVYGTEVDFCEELGFRKMKGAVALELVVESPDAKTPTAKAPVASAVS